MTDDIEVYEVTAPAAQTLLELAIGKGADLATLEKLMDLQERHEKNEARKAYTVAMAAFKADPPKIFKDKKVSFTTAKGKTEYDHATIGNVVGLLSAAMGKHGLSHGWTTTQANGAISVTCTVTHVMGHSESTTLTAAADESGGKNSIQAVASTVSYLERYTLLAITGQATNDMDNDGGGAAEVITDEQATTLQALIDSNLADDATYRKRFLDYMKVESLSDIKANDFTRARAAIQAAIKAKGKPKPNTPVDDDAAKQAGYYTKFDQRTVDAWLGILDGKDDLEPDWWPGNKADIISDCGEAGAKVVHAHFLKCRAKFSKESAK